MSLSNLNFVMVIYEQLKYLCNCYNITLMNFRSSSNIIKINKNYQSMLVVLVFCTAFFAHSQHYCQVLPDISVKAEVHECYFCQQLLDSLPNDLSIFPLSLRQTLDKVLNFSSLPIVLSAYVYPLLRAPPTF